MKDKLIQIQNISVVKQKKSILENINFDINTNDFITIIGPNGAGKSMLLKCIIGLETSYSGKIDKKQNLKIGYMPQSIHLNHMIPLKVSHFLKLNNNIKKDIFYKVLQQTSIEDLLDLSLHSLSGGQMQKVLMARAMLREPQIMILDEPAQNLDIAGQIEFYKLLDKVYQNSNMSILMVSHDLHFVMKDSKKVICLFKHICCSGEPNIVANAPEFTSLFGKDTHDILKSYKHTIEHKNHTH